jgi:uncharacterized membrane protein YfcA
MHVDGYIVLAGAIVGLAVGLTGMGGGALMTPVLVLLFGVTPLTAISSDLVASLVMKPVGSLVHLRRRTAHLRIAGSLCAGSVPAAFAGAVLLRTTASGPAVQEALKLALGAALLLAVCAMALRAWMERRRGPAASPQCEQEVRVKPVLTLLLGAAGGLIVGMTSVGSGSLMIVALMFLYPALSGRRLVGTDLVQSVPLVAAAALGQVLFGQVQLGLTVSLVIGAVPAVYVGSRISAGATNRWLRPAIAVVLLGSGLKLVQASNLTTAAILAAALVLAAGSAWTRRHVRLTGTLARPPT